MAMIHIRSRQLEDALNGIGLPARVQRVIVTVKLQIPGIKSMNQYGEEVLRIRGDAVLNLFQGAVINLKFILMHEMLGYNTELVWDTAYVVFLFPELDDFVQ